MIRSLARGGVVLLALVACKKEGAPASARMEAPSSVPVDPPGGKAPVAPPTATAPAAGGGISGTVVETMDASTYTYARLDHGGTKIWIAGPETKLAVGAKLGKMTGQLMTAFKSDTLKRTFDQIYFVGAWGEGGPVAAAHPEPAKPAVAEPVEKVAPAKGGKSIADVIANKATLAKTQVAVRGKVVKVNNGILGKNWIHLRDGSGAGGAADILVTSAAEAKLGDIVVARGAVALDQDFGAGYKYDVLVENATFAAE